MYSILISLMSAVLACFRTRHVLQTEILERLIGTLRRECLDRMLIWNERHLRCVLTEIIDWYNHSRVHQALNGIPDPDPVLAEPKPAGGRLVAMPVLNGLHHDYRLAA